MTDRNHHATLPPDLDALARLWLARARLSMHGGSEAGADMADLNDGLLAGDPFRVIALILRILALDPDEDTRSYVAATLLEGVLPREEGALLAAVEATIGADPGFADLFFDILWNGLEGPVEDRIVAAISAALARGGPGGARR
jgi:hypothetical protein